MYYAYIYIYMYNTHTHTLCYKLAIRDLMQRDKRLVARGHLDGSSGRVVRRVDTYNK